MVTRKHRQSYRHADHAGNGRGSTAAFWYAEYGTWSLATERP